MSNTSVAKRHWNDSAECGASILRLPQPTDSCLRLTDAAATPPTDTDLWHWKGWGVRMARGKQQQHPLLLQNKMQKQMRRDDEANDRKRAATTTKAALQKMQQPNKPLDWDRNSLPPPHQPRFHPSTITNRK